MTQLGQVGRPLVHAQDVVFNIMVYNHPVSRGIIGLMSIEPIMPRATGDYNISSLAKCKQWKKKPQIKGSAFGFLEDGRELNYNPHLTNRKK